MVTGLLSRPLAPSRTLKVGRPADLMLISPLRFSSEIKFSSDKPSYDAGTLHTGAIPPGPSGGVPLFFCVKNKCENIFEDCALTVTVGPPH